MIRRPIAFRLLACALLLPLPAWADAPPAATPQPPIASPLPPPAPVNPPADNPPAATPPGIAPPADSPPLAPPSARVPAAATPTAPPEVVCPPEGSDAPVPEECLEPPAPRKRRVRHTTTQYLPQAPWKRGARLAAYVGAGLVGALAIAAGTSLIVREHYADQWNDDSRCLGHGLYRIDNCFGIYQHANDAEGLAADFAVAGGVVAVVSVVMLLSSRPEKAPERKKAAAVSSVSCGSGPGLFGVACGGTF